MWNNEGFRRVAYRRTSEHFGQINPAMAMTREVIHLVLSNMGLDLKMLG